MALDVKNQSEMEPAELESEERWILRLLYEPGSSTSSTLGKRRIMYGCFLMAKKFEDECNNKLPFSFEMGEYGPEAKGVDQAIESLKSKNLISFAGTTKQESDLYTLSRPGGKLARQLYQDLDEGQKELITWIKRRHVRKSRSKLLSFIYNQYPYTKG